MIEPALVRDAVLDDAEAIARVHGRAWQAGYAGQLPAEHLDRLTATLGERAERWRSVLGTSVEHVLVASFASRGGQSGEVLGICTYGEARDTEVPDGYGELWMINLDPAAWGTGLADALFAAAVARLAERFDGAYLWVLDSNQRAQRFYRRQGWTYDHVTKHDQVAGTAVTELRYSIRFGAS